MCRRSEVENPPRSAGIAAHLRGKLPECGEPLLIAQLRHELHFELAPIEVSAEVEEMRLEQRHRSVHGRTRAETGHAAPDSSAGIRGIVGAAHAYGEDPGHRSPPSRERQV